MNRIGPEDMLQERLERLDSGESQEACMADAPEGIVDTLKIATRLMALEWPERSPEGVHRKYVENCVQFHSPTPDSCLFQAGARVIAFSPNPGYRAGAVFARVTVNRGPMRSIH